jgi:hypothetical protein
VSFFSGAAWRDEASPRMSSSNGVRIARMESLT